MTKAPFSPSDLTGITNNTIKDTISKTNNWDSHLLWHGHPGPIGGGGGTLVHAQAGQAGQGPHQLLLLLQPQLLVQLVHCVQLLEGDSVSKSLKHITMISEKATLRDNNNNNNNDNTNLARQGLNDSRAVAVAHHVVGCAATVDEPWWTQ